MQEVFVHSFQISGIIRCKYPVGYHCLQVSMFYTVRTGQARVSFLGLASSAR